MMGSSTPNSVCRLILLSPAGFLRVASPVVYPTLLESLIIGVGSFFGSRPRILPVTGTVSRLMRAAGAIVGRCGAGQEVLWTRVGAVTPWKNAVMASCRKKNAE